MADAGTLAELGDRARQHLSIEHALFEATGRAARDTNDAPLSVVLGRACEHHAWRVGEWVRRLPDLEHVAVGPPERGVADLAVGSGVDADSLVVSLFNHWLPQLAEDYERHLAATDPAVDAPTAQTLRRVLDDLASERRLLHGVADR